MKRSIFFSLITFLAVSATECYATDMIRPEDEIILENDYVLEVGSDLRSNEKQIVEKEIPHTTPYMIKEERKAQRAPAAVWFDEEINQDFLRDNTIDEAAEEEFQYYRDRINECYTNNKDRLNIEKDMLGYNNKYEATAYISHTFEEIGNCYENVGYDIINNYYDADRDVAARFADDATTFYVKGTTADFDPRFCEENCSLKAVVLAQEQKFTEFRAYLHKLLKDRPLKTNRK